MSDSPSSQSGNRTNKHGRPWVAGRRSSAHVVSAADEKTTLDEWERRRGELTLRTS